MSKKNNILKYVLINALVFGVIILISLALTKMPEFFKHLSEQAEIYKEMQEEVQKQLGFQFEIQSISYIKGGKGAEEAYEGSGSAAVITKIVEGKPMANAGFKELDIFAISYGFEGGVIQPFIFLQEKTVTFPMIRNKQAMDISIIVPKLDLSTDPNELRWPFSKPSKLLKYNHSQLPLSPDDIYN